MVEDLTISISWLYVFAEGWSIAWFDQSALFFTSEENVSGVISLNHKSPGDYADGETPDPIPNSEVKPCSVSSCSVVLGHVNLGKLATTYFITLLIFSVSWHSFITYF